MVIDGYRSGNKEAKCPTYRNFGVELTKPTPENAERTRLTRKVIQEVKFGRLAISDIPAFIDEGMENIEVGNDLTKELQKKEVHDLVNRYLDFDKRASYGVKTKEYSFHGHIIKVRPNFLYISNTAVKEYRKESFKEVTLVEVVTLTAGKNRMSSSNRAAEEASVYLSLESLGFLLYGKEILGNREGIVRVCFDSLKTGADKKSDYSEGFKVAETMTNGSPSKHNRIWYEVYFDKKGHIIPCLYNTEKPIGKNGHIKVVADGYARSRSEYTVNKDLKNIFKTFAEAVEHFLEGKAPTKTVCAECSFRGSCTWSELPKEKPRPPVKKVGKGGVSITDEQSDVIEAKEGVFIVDAGPGSGKTFTMVLRVVDLLLNGVRPEDILLLSFSKAAVTVLKERIAEYIEGYGLPVKAEAIKVATFNSIGDIVIRKHYEKLGFTEEPALIDDIESYDLVLKSIDYSDPVEGFDYKNINMAFNSVLGAGKAFEKEFATIRSFNYTREEYKEAAKRKGFNEAKSDKIYDTYERYVGLMKAGNYIDYSDQNNLVEGLIKEDFTLVSDMYDVPYIIVDEFQDSNDFQILFLKVLMAGLNFKSLMVVGDDAQAIYGFRGTSPENIINFEKKIGTDCEDFLLTQNNRSTPEIVELSNEIFPLQRGGYVDKKMTARRASVNSKPLFKAFASEKYEQQYIAERIKELIEKGVNPSDIAFISHNKGSLNKVKKLLNELGVMTQFDMPVEMLSNSRVQAAIGLARFVKEQENTEGLFTYLNGVYSNKLLSLGSEAVNDLIKTNKEDFVRVYQDLSPDDKKAYIINLLNVLTDEKDSVYTEFFKKVRDKAKYSSEETIRYMIKFDDYKSGSAAENKCIYEAVNLVTAHSSKGKEWEYVFGTLSDYDSQATISTREYDEKIRLIFVMVTRARTHLTVTTNIYADRQEDKDYKRVNRFYAILKDLKGFTFEDVEPEPEKGSKSA